METLAEVVKPLSGNKRQFVLLKVSGLDSSVAMAMVGVNRGTYNSWFKNETFNAIYKLVPDLIVAHRDEALQLLRRGNQLEAVILEGKMIRRLADEIDSGQLVLARTHLGREVYSKLMSDLDKVPQSVRVETWDQKVLALINNPQGQLQEGHVDGEFKEVSSVKTEHQESDTPSES